MRQINKLLFISESNFPNDAANTIVTLKMCSAFSKFTQTDLLTSFFKDYFKKLKKDFILKNKFRIISSFKKPKKINFIIRLIIFFKALNLINKEKYDYIFTRSVIISVLLSYLKHRNILEFHHSNTGFTKYFFLLYQKIFKNKYQRFVLINKNINKELKILRENLLFWIPLLI